MFDQKFVGEVTTRHHVLLADGAERECACGHRLDAHDRIAGRYCAATTTSAISRGCICDTNPKVTLR